MGQVVNDLPPKQRNIAMVFQSYALYPHMTVFDNMAFGLKLEKRSKDEINDRVQEGCKNFTNRRLSSQKTKTTIWWSKTKSCNRSSYYS
jgi:ABC-type sugar transport system ATPase subunit